MQWFSLRRLDWIGGRKYYIADCLASLGGMEGRYASWEEEFEFSGKRAE